MNRIGAGVAGTRHPTMLAMFPGQVSGISVALILFALVGSAGDDLNPVTFRRAPRHPDVVLVKDGLATGEIVLLNTDRMPALAAQDLRRFIKATTGAELPIVKARTGIPAIVIGPGPDMPDAGINPSDLPPEGFAIVTAPGTVCIVGADAPGTTWGIYEFLERFVNVRWYWPEDRTSDDLVGTSIMPSDRLIVKPVFLTDQPSFRKRHRWPSGGPGIGNADMTAHDRRLRSHSSWPVALIVHAPHGWSSLYGATRPEIFQLRSDGKRDLDMLCYGNARTLATYLEEIDAQLAMIREEKPIEPKRRIIDGNTITVSPADMSISCRCANCRALWNDNGGIYGTASGIMGKFVSSLAQEVKRRWPEMTVLFLPYKNYTYAPDNVAFPGNVEIQICGMPGLAQYKDPLINAAEQANIDAWLRLSARRIQNWHYSCWPADRTKAAYLFPHVAKNHYVANRHKTVGSFINGTGNHWPRQHVTLYAWLKVLWNPDFDVDAAIDEYCSRMYGPSAGHMRKLVRMLIDGWEKSAWTKHTFSPKAVYEESYPRQKVVKMEELLRKAYADARDNALVTRRLDYYAKPLGEFFAESAQYAEGTGLRTLTVFQVPEDPVVDGKLDEDAWRDVPGVPFVMAYDKVNVQPRFPTTLKAVWTRRGVTFGFHMIEPEPERIVSDIGKDTRDASLLWWNDNVEIFLDVTGQRSGYYQIIANLNGAILDTKDSDLSWNATDVKAAAVTGNGCWTTEVFVPISSFADAVPPGTGVEWYGNFTRHRVTDRKQREYQRLNTTFATPSNDQNAFGPIRFIER